MSVAGDRRRQPCAHARWTTDPIALAAIIGAAIVALAILLTYRYAKPFAERIGHRGMIVVLRLSAFIVLSIGVQIAWNGVKALLKEVGIPPA